MNKQQLITHIAGETGLPFSQVRLVMDHLLQAATQTLQQGDNLSLRSFGSLRPLRQQDRPGRNPRTGEPALIPARTTVKFSPGVLLLKSLNEHGDNY